MGSNEGATYNVLLYSLANPVQTQGSKSEIMKALVALSIGVQHEAFLNRPDQGWSESKTLKPLIIQAIMKVITLLLNNETFRNIFDDLAIDRVAMGRLFMALPIENTIDPRIRNLKKQFEPAFTLQEYSNDPTLKPKTIPQIAIKLASMYFTSLELTQENIATVINEYLSTTGQDRSIVNEDFINILINADDGTNKNSALKGCLPENPKEFIREAIETFAPQRTFSK